MARHLLDDAADMGMSAELSNYRVDRRRPSPSAQRRSGELWKARLGLAAVVVLTFCSAVLMFRIAGSSLASVLGTNQPQQTVVTARPTVSGGQLASTQQAPAVPTPAPTAVPAPARSREHTVESGDSLFGIAQRYGTTIDAIMTANNMRDRSQVLNVGQKLAIP